MSRNTGSVASSDSSWLKLYAAVAVLPLALAACGGGGGGGGSPAPTPTPTPSPAPTPTPAPSPGPAIGLNWSTVSVGSVGNLVGVDYAGTRFVAVTDTGTGITSTDAATWTAVTPLTSNVTTDHLTAYAIGHSGSNFVAVGSTSSAPYTAATGAVAISADGQTWTMESLPAGATPIHGLVSGTRLVALGEGGHLYYSTNNGQSWAVLTTLAAAGIGTMNAGAYGGGKYVAVGNNGYIAASSDGVIWESAKVIVVSGAGVNLNGIAWTGSQFVAVGDNGMIATSVNGVMGWTPHTSAIGGALRSVTVSTDGTIVVVGDSGIETSPDGVTWTARNDSGVAVLSGVAFGNGRFVAVGATSTVKTSNN